MIDIIKIKSGEIVDKVPDDTDPVSYLNDANRMHAENNGSTEDAYMLDEKQYAEYAAVKRHEQLKEAINNEAKRRICAFIGATSVEDCLAKQQSYANAMIAIQVKKTDGDEITDADRQTETFILQGYAGVEHIIAKSDGLLNGDNIPDDFTDDKYWV